MGMPFGRIIQVLLRNGEVINVDVGLKPRVRSGGRVRLERTLHWVTSVAPASRLDAWEAGHTVAWEPSRNRGDYDVSDVQTLNANMTRYEGVFGEIRRLEARAREEGPPSEAIRAD
jgi:hypothetical protein